MSYSTAKVAEASGSPLLDTHCTPTRKSWTKPIDGIDRHNMVTNGIEHLDGKVLG